MSLEEVHRFPNTPVRLPDGLHWDVLHFHSEMKDGLAKAMRKEEIEGIGIDSWGVAPKNSMAAGRNASAYSSAKAAELHLARCLAEEGGPERIRVNTVNPDAVLQGSRIWGSAWREKRAAYGIGPDEFEDYYRERNVLKVNVLPENVAEAVLHFASEARSSRSTGNVLNVDGGVKDAYPR